MSSQPSKYPNLSVIVEAIYYFISRFERCDSLKMVKLIYLADKYHLIQFGRTITDDEYFAMRRGPVGSLVADVISFNENILSEDEIAMIKGYFQPGREYILLERTQVGRVPEHLSKSDLHALEEVLESFGQLGRDELVKLVHRFPEWDQYKVFFRNNSHGRKHIDDAELISKSLVATDLPGIDDEQISEAKAFITGSCL